MNFQLTSIFTASLITLASLVSSMPVRADMPVLRNSVIHPPIKLPNLDSISRPAWVVSRGEIPQNALKVGYDSFVTEEDGHIIAKNPADSLYLCRAIYQGTIYPGKLYKGYCYITFDGNEYRSKIFQVLVNVPAEKISWASTASGGFMPLEGFAFVGGGDSTQKIYVCRAEHKGGLHPGKIVNSNCKIDWGGKEISIANYEVLYINGVLDLPGAIELSKQCYPATDEPEAGVFYAHVCTSRPLK